MNSEEFALVFDEQIKRCSETLFDKAKEYATDDDRLHNFNLAGRLKGTNPAEALGGFMLKHTISIYDMLGVDDPHLFTEEQWNEKITDHINYLILLQAVLRESRYGLYADNTNKWPICG